MLNNKAVIPSDATMELIAHLYSFMTEEDKAEWSLTKAEEMVDDQYRYEIDEGITPSYYSVMDFYEIIAEFIAQDAEANEE